MGEVFLYVVMLFLSSMNRLSISAESLGSVAHGLATIGEMESCRSVAVRCLHIHTSLDQPPHILDLTPLGRSA